MSEPLKMIVSFCLLCALLVACGTPSSKSSVKLRQYYLKGQELYSQHCSNCHQEDGSGLKMLYPPLDSSDYLLNRRDDVLCIIRHGASGEMTVNGKVFNQPMPANLSLTDLEVAQIATFIYNSWSNEEGIIEVKDASGVLSSCR